MVAWGPIAETPYPGEPGGLPADITGDPSGGLDDPSVVLPESAVQLVEADGTHVAWLALAKTWTYRVSKYDPGSGSVTLARSDPLADELVFPRQLVFFDRGEVDQRSLIEPRDDTTVAQSEESGQEVTAGNPGALALTARGRVDPIKLTLKPKQGSVRFSFAHPDYDDTVTGWEPAADVGDFDRPTDWPGGGTNIWGASGDHDFAPGGSVYFRGPDWTNPTEQVLAYVWHVDNSSTGLFLDGGQIAALEDIDASNFNTTHEFRFTTSAGTHQLAAHGFNQSTDEEEPPPDGNPGALRVGVWTLDANGELATLLHSTSTSWKAYEFLSARPPELERPGWTAGSILIWLLDRWEARTGFVVARSFDELVDTDGVDWPLILDFTAAVGGLYEALQSLSEAHCDLAFGPAADELHAWVKDTRGTVTTDALPTGYADEDDGCLMSLSHTTEPPVCTSALIEWRDGFVIVDSEADTTVERKIDAPLVDSATAATVIGQAAVDVFGVERVQGTAQVRWRHSYQRPGTGFGVADTRNLPDRTGALVPQVIQAYQRTVDRDGNIRDQIEFGDAMFNQEERFTNWIKGITNGSLGGRTFQTTPYREELRLPTVRRARTVIPFDHLATDATGESHPITIDDYGTIQAFTVDIPGEEGGTFVVNVNGSPVDSMTVAASVPSQTERWDEKVGPGDQLTVESDDAIAYVATVRIV